jgi:hypothetical protein
LDRTKPYDTTPIPMAEARGLHSLFVRQANFGIDITTFAQDFHKKDFESKRKGNKASYL